jgi:hypothetical protein
MSSQIAKSPAKPRDAAGGANANLSMIPRSPMHCDDAQSFGRITSWFPDPWGMVGELDSLSRKRAWADPSGCVRFLPLAVGESFRSGRRVLAMGEIYLSRERFASGKRVKPIRISGFLVPRKSEASVTVSAVAAVNGWCDQRILATQRFVSTPAAEPLWPFPPDGGLPPTLAAYFDSREYPAEVSRFP